MRSAAVTPVTFRVVLYEVRYPHNGSCMVKKACEAVNSAVLYDSGKDQELHPRICTVSKEARSKHKKYSLLGMVMALSSLLIDITATSCFYWQKYF